MLLENKIVFLCNPHFEKSSIKIICYFNKSKLRLHEIEILQRKKAYQQYQSDIDHIGKYNFTFYLHNFKYKLRDGFQVGIDIGWSYYK